MKWLVDAQLPPLICDWLQRHNENATHVSELENGLRLSDDALWEEAKRNQQIILSKDRDFFEHSLLYGAPPQVVHIAVGNCSNQALLAILEATWKDMHDFLAQKKPLFVVTKKDMRTFNK